MNVYVFFRSAPVVSCFCCLLLTAVGLGAEILYNGIRLPSPWPPTLYANTISNLRHVMHPPISLLTSFPPAGARRRARQVGQR